MGQYFENDKLPSNIKMKETIIREEKFYFNTDNGVFSKDGVDFGSRLLLESIDFSELTGSGLDVGCGYGVLGIVISKLTSCNMDMIDVNLRALHLANINACKNNIGDYKIYESSCYENVRDKYNFIITNPPIRAGKKIVYDILLNAKKYLKETGVLFFVIRKEQGAKTIINDMKKEYNLEVICKKKGFFVIKCTF